RSSRTLVKPGMEYSPLPPIIPISACANPSLLQQTSQYKGRSGAGPRQRVWCLRLRHNEQSDRLRREGGAEIAGGASRSRWSHRKARLQDDGGKIGVAVEVGLRGAVRLHVGQLERLR